MAVTDQRQSISAALADFESRPLAEAAIALFESLGYTSERRLALDNDPGTYLAEFDDPETPLDRNRALFNEWKSIALLFQFTDTGIDWQSAKLKRDGKLKRVGSAKGRHWEVVEKQA